MRFLSPLTFCVLDGKVHSDPSAQGYGCVGHPKHIAVSVAWLVWGWHCAHQQGSCSLTGKNMLVLTPSCGGQHGAGGAQRGVALPKTHLKEVVPCLVFHG